MIPTDGGSDWDPPLEVEEIVRLLVKQSQGLGGAPPMPWDLAKLDRDNIFRFYLRTKSQVDHEDQKPPSKSPKQLYLDQQMQQFGRTREEAEKDYQRVMKFKAEIRAKQRAIRSARKRKPGVNDQEKIPGKSWRQIGIHARHGRKTE